MTDDGRRGRVVLISGSPGSGKSTLGMALSHRLLVPHVSKDRMSRGMWLHDPSRTYDDLNISAWALFWSQLHALAGAGCTVVAEQTLWRGWSEAPARELGAVTTLVHVHLRAEAALDRWEARMRAESPPTPRPLDQLIEDTRRRADEFTDPLDLGCPVLEVRTDEGYDPSLEALAELVLR